VQAGGGRYLKRKVDEEFLELCRKGEFAFVLTARQIVDLSQVGVRVTPDEWYLGIISEIEEALDLDTDVYAWWEAHAHLGLTQRLTQFFRDVALKEVQENIVVFFDEIDSTLSLEFTDDFFAAIRYVYNARSKVEDFRRLSFVLIGVATPSDLISDATRTPFNIGSRVDVQYFTFNEALPLAEGFGQSPERGQQILSWILKWTGGHPYLTQRLSYAVAEEDCGTVTEDDVARIVAATFFGERSEQDSNLRFVHDMLTLRAPDPTAVLSMYKSVLAGKRVDDEKQSRIVTHLKLSGIVRGERGALIVQNAIYAHVFDLNWLNRQWPEHWIRRVPPAVIGLVAASFIAIVLLGVLFMESQRRSQAQEYNDELTIVNEKLLVQQDSVVSLNSELSSQLTTAEALRTEAETARGRLAEQFRITDALRREEEVLNQQLSEQVNRAESLLVEVSRANASLSVERDQSDSLRHVAVSTLDQARSARRETITIALANKAVRLLKLGDPALAALLARQAYAFSDPEEGEFLDPIYDALRQSLN
jgi:Skp family chaperone for outer membrane proteins